MRRIKVAFLLPSLQGGGAEKATITLVNNLDRKYFKPLVVICRNERCYFSPRHDVPVINLNKSRTRYTLLPLMRFLKKEKPDILYSAMWHINFIAICTKILAHVSTHVVISVHNNPTMTLLKEGRRWIISLIYSKFYKKADRVIGVSKGVVNDLKSYGVPEEKLQAIYNPVVDKEIFSQQLEDVNHPWFQKGETVILSVGRIVEQKGYPYLIRAFAKVRKRLDAKLVILGEGEDLQRLKMLAKEVSIDDSVDFVGFQKNPFKYMYRAACFVLSSLWEGHGLVLIEAMACGTPVISTRCPYGPEEIITDGVNGLLVPVRDEVALAKAIIKVLTDKELARKLRKNGKERAMDFSVKKMVDESEKLFKSLTTVENP
ncbi:MAG: glycosyltransferase [bacterium]|nr:glycosyltransferase [bacterium]